MDIVRIVRDISFCSFVGLLIPITIYYGYDVFIPLPVPAAHQSHQQDKENATKTTEYTQEQKNVYTLRFYVSFFLAFLMIVAAFYCLAYRLISTTLIMGGIFTVVGALINHGLFIKSSNLFVLLLGVLIAIFIAMAFFLEKEQH